MNIATQGTTVSADSHAWSGASARSRLPAMPAGTHAGTASFRETSPLRASPNGHAAHIGARHYRTLRQRPSRVGLDLSHPAGPATTTESPTGLQVSDLLVAGENRIEIWLGDGWYRSQLM